MCVNIEAAKELVKRYRSITLEELQEESMKVSKYLRKSTILTHLTNFGTENCPVCSEAKRVCVNCILYHCHVSCFHQDTYQAIMNSWTLEELLIAIHNRADYIEQLIKEQNGD